jgi:SAM-dependent methyltransferase
MKLKTGILALRNLRQHSHGWCPICGRRSMFLQLHGGSLREGLRCVGCAGVSRKRHVAAVLVAELGMPRASVRAAHASHPCRVHSTEAAGPLAAALAGRPGFSSSDLVPGVELGTELAPWSTCQDLERLTFADDSIDVVITEDVLEHVRRTDAVFAEIARVLAPGGRHIFTIPFRPDAPTLVRVDTTGADDVHLLPAEYHGDPIRGQILAYRTFGYDLFPQLDRHGFRTRWLTSGRPEARMGIYDSNVFVSTLIGR